MIVLHAVWLPRSRRLALWAEDGSLPRLAPTRRGRPPRVPRPRPHPFAAGTEDVRLAVAELAGPRAADLLDDRGTRLDLDLELPTVPAGPVPSAWLEDDAPPASGPGAPTVTAAPWTVHAVIPGRAEVADVLGRLQAAAGADHDGAPVAGLAVALAADLRVAARTVQVVVELVARGRVLPGLEHEDGRWTACWRPLIGPGDRRRVAALGWAVPPSLSACIGGDGAAAGGASDDGAASGDAPTSSALLRDLAHRTTDDLVRSVVGEPPSPPARGRSAPGPADAWLAALTAADGAVDADPDAVAELAGRITAWHATADAGAEVVRTCFRIGPPPADDEVDDGADDEDADEAEDAGAEPTAGDRTGDDRWRIEFALQAVDDPSLLVPARAVWEDGVELTAMERLVPHADEHLLRGLGRAARLVPSLGPALASPTPEDQLTDAQGVVAFLTEGAPVLEEAGFGVLAPPWWRSDRRRLGLRMKAKSVSKGGGPSAGLGLDGLCDVRWEAVLGDDTLTVAELRQLARAKQPLVRLRGQWVELHHDELAAAITAVGRRSGGADRRTAGEVLRTALGLEGTTGGLPVTDVVADGWLGDLLAGAEDRSLEALPTPDGFAGELRPYQQRGLGWLSFLGDLGLGACLADDMGLGKTAQLLALLVAERVVVGDAPRRRPAKVTVASKPATKGRGGKTAIAPGVGPTLVLCPMSLVGNWQREAERFAPKLSVYVHHGSDRLADKDFTAHARRADLVLSTYGVAVRDQELLATVAWHRLVLDEAQQIKNSAARTTRSVRGIPAGRRVAMTGTPVENRLGELWSIMHFLNPGMLGSERVFQERFAAPIERGGDDEAAGRLRRITAPFVLRRLKTDRSIIADLPDKLEMREFCNLTREQATLYQAVVDDMLARIEESTGMERRGLVLATMLKLKQVCNHPAHFLGDGSTVPGRSGKVTRLVQVLDEAVAEGDRALVFTQFTEMGEMLERHIRAQLGCEVAWLHGGVTKKRRDAMVERFQAPDGPPVFLLSLKAGGTGLNLTAATHVVHFDRWWNPAVEDQATDRAFRIGQQRNVQVRKFVCAGTLEERIDAMIEAKRALAERIVGSGEGWITELDTEQLREIVALSADAVGDD